MTDLRERRASVPTIQLHRTCGGFDIDGPRVNLGRSIAVSSVTDFRIVEGAGVAAPNGDIALARLHIDVAAMVSALPTTVADLGKGEKILARGFQKNVAIQDIDIDQAGHRPATREAGMTDGRIAVVAIARVHHQPGLHVFQGLNLLLNHL